jgi:hypothetical protein
MCVPHTWGKLVLSEAVRFELNCSYSLNFIQEKNPYQLIPSFFIVAALCVHIPQLGRIKSEHGLGHGHANAIVAHCFGKKG